jgi:hypothetical protein
MSGLESLGYATAVAIPLMAAIFALSRLLLRYGLYPMSAAFSLSGFNYLLLYLLVFPGTVVHELSHYLACLLLGVRVHEVRLFAPQANGVLGWVAHERPDPLRRVLIALAPFLGGSLAMYLLLRFGLSSTPGHELVVNISDLGQGLSAAVTFVVDTLRSGDLHQLATWLVLYCLFSLGFAVAPSADDLAPLAAYALVTLALVLGLKLVDEHYALGIAQSPLIGAAAGALASVVQNLNGLLVFACAVVGLAALIVVPLAMVALWLRQGLGF